MIAAGALLLLPASRTYALERLDKYWPLFLALAGAVRIAGFLFDREPRSPVGGVMLATLGGILLAINLSQELVSAPGLVWLILVSRYWFWLLLAFVAGRVLRQYAGQMEGATGSRPPRAFSFGAVCVMLLIVAAGLAANYAERHPADSLTTVAAEEDQ